MNPLPPFGRQLRHWRARRRVSQLDLAVEAGVSARHLSFLETGRASPSRAMVLRLGTVLELPLRDRNALLLTAGYAPAYGERPLDDPALAPVRHALQFLLSRHEPYPAFVIDRLWNIRLANNAHRRLLALLQQAGGMPPEDPENALKLVLAPDRLRPTVANWPQVARAVLTRLERQLRSASHDDALVALRNELFQYPDVADIAAASAGHEEAPGLLIPLVLTLGGRTLSWYTTIASFGAPLDATLQEAVIESLLPADDETQRFVHQLAAHQEGPPPEFGAGSR